MTSVSRRYAKPSGPFERSSGAADPAGRAPVVLMVSGGADSTALLVLAATSRLDIEDGRGLGHIARERLHVLHVNHKLRGLDAEEDEEFVRELSASYGIPCTVVAADVAGIARGQAAAGGASAGNVENAGRELRYASAARLANELSGQMGTPRSAARILTAHTADDRAETFFMNAIKGTGPAGLSSIPRRRNRIVRPLLDRTHDELCELLRMAGVVWREDATNADTHYLRSFVRHQIMPPAKARNPRLVDAMASTCDILSDEDAYLTQVASRALRDLERRREEGLEVLDAARLAATDVAIARRVVRDAIRLACPACRLEARHVAAVLEAVAAGEGSCTVPMGVDVSVEYGLLFVRTRASADEPVSGWLDVPGLAGAVSLSPSSEVTAPGARAALDLGGGLTMTARLVAAEPGVDPTVGARAVAREWDGEAVLLDAAACGVAPEGGRVWVDGPQPGDVCCPLGMHGQSKKLSDLLIDEKVPAPDRPQVRVVRTAPTGAVVWIAGIRPDERARCTPATKVLLELRICSA
ncbi:MAG: tRNA lysidine(34) synthetase TilS [Atopobiaceae bacterium]|nr:tRNA lysidine(34) synthetase TilS [Atopobiaceae bacterium]MCH4181440.1 tRNA lysidine(34) synthetase TilS [Atopobiaceae bacterium]MCH4214853.1 tRNA lysidine(34) synthetase TilS [Atopobiaceae bacterium]MCH4230099.1 tRNA lysidine(34) synthetase TilS [Atopobiaceae bacterium]MCH4276975.1 tRNA lysidine(34) synthetase TilS [Atopobiaceae bacterium]